MTNPLSVVIKITFEFVYYEFQWNYHLFISLAETYQLQPWDSHEGLLSLIRRVHARSGLLWTSSNFRLLVTSYTLQSLFEVALESLHIRLLGTLIVFYTSVLFFLQYVMWICNYPSRLSSECDPEFSRVSS